MDSHQHDRPLREAQDSENEEAFFDQLPTVSQREISEEQLRRWFHPDKTRHRLVFWLLAVTAGEILTSWVAISAGWVSVTQGKELLATTLGPLFTLLGTAVAFFFRGDGPRKQ